MRRETVAVTLRDHVRSGSGDRTCAGLLGKISDALGVATDPEKMRLSLLVCPVACAMAALLLWLGSRTRVAAAGPPRTPAC